MKFNKRIAITLILAVVIVPAVGYRLRNIPVPPPVGSDNSILTQQPCALPCWYGFTPSESSIEAVKAAIPNIPLLSNSNYNGEGLSFGDYYIGQMYQSGFRVSFRFKGDKLYSLRINPYTQYDLHNILELYGSPTGVTISYYVTGEIMSERLVLNLYYPQAGLVASFKIYGGHVGKRSYEIRPEARGTEFYVYPASTTLEQLVTYERQGSESNAKASLMYEFKRGWPGFYSVIIDPVPSIELPYPPNIQSPDMLPFPHLP